MRDLETETRAALEQALRDEVERHGFRVAVLDIRERTEGFLPVVLSVIDGERRAANYVVERNAANTFLKFSEWLQGGARCQRQATPRIPDPTEFWPRRTS